MERFRLTFLKAWLEEADRRPLVIRGARQVGKTWLVRELAKIGKKELIEINFEKKPELASLFASNDPAQILLNLSASFNKRIDPHTSLLFLDEIQAKPELLSKLRWFAEDLSELAVIATGSLLEFTLEKHEFSMPVGRIQYMHLEPFSFEEFLNAKNQHGLIDFLKSFNLSHSKNIPEAIHQQLSGLFKEYIIVGGLPQAVSAWSKDPALSKINQIHHDLLDTYRTDFGKYNGRINIHSLDKVMMAVPTMIGRKFIYSHVSNTLDHGTIKSALELLNKARICHRTKACSANGVPLGAEIREKYFKQIFLDVGLVSAALRLNLSQLNNTEEITLIHSGAIAEQVVGQLLRTIFPPYMEPGLYYWQREEKGSNAELDYVIEHGNKVIPIEVKAGSAGSLKSLHLFMGVKNLPLAVRLNSDLPSIVRVEVKDPIGKNVSYQLLSIPFYLIHEAPRLIEGFVSE